MKKCCLRIVNSTLLTNNKKDLDPFLLHYSEYKFGSANQASRFAHQLKNIIIRALPIAYHEGFKNYVIVVPPFGTLESPIFYVCKILGTLLNIKVIALRTPGSSGAYYSETKSIVTRGKIFPTISMVYHTPKSNLEKKNILLVDDMLVTGSTIKFCEKYLKLHYVNNIYSFSIVKLNTKKYWLEGEVNDYIKARKNLLVSILNKNKTVINRNVIKSLLKNQYIETIKKRIQKERFRKIKRAMRIYFSKTKDEEIKSYIRSL